MQLDMGLGGGLSAAFPGTAGTNANASPQGPRTAAEAGFGTTVGDEAKMSGATTGVLSVGTLALAALVWIWWALPR